MLFYICYSLVIDEIKTSFLFAKLEMFHAKASTRQGKANKDLKPRKQAKQTKLFKIDGRLLMILILLWQELSISIMTAIKKG